MRQKRNRPFFRLTFPDVLEQCLLRVALQPLPEVDVVRVARCHLELVVDLEYGREGEKKNVGLTNSKELTWFPSMIKSFHVG